MLTVYVADILIRKQKHLIWTNIDKQIKMMSWHSTVGKIVIIVVIITYYYSGFVFKLCTLFIVGCGVAEGIVSSSPLTKLDLTTHVMLIFFLIKTA